MATWKPIEGFTNYEVSDEGYVRNTHTGRILKQSIVGGYAKVDLYQKGKRTNMKVHRLVAKAFIPNPENKATVNHKDENKLNNNVSNLEWMTQKENSNYGTRNQRITQKKSKRVKCIETDTIYNSLKEAAAALGISMTSISQNCHGKQKTAGGYHWKFVDEI